MKSSTTLIECKEVTMTSHANGVLRFRVLVMDKEHPELTSRLRAFRSPASEALYLMRLGMAYEKSQALAGVPNAPVAASAPPSPLPVSSAKPNGIDARPPRSVMNAGFSAADLGGPPPGI